MGIRVKLFLPLLLGFLVFYGVLHFFATPFYLNYEKDQFSQQQSRITDALKPAMIQSLIQGDLGALYENLDESFSQNGQEWLSVALYDSNNKQIYPLDEPLNEFNIEVIKTQKDLIFDGENLGQFIIYSNWENKREEKKYFAEVITGITLAIFSFIGLLSLIWQTLWISLPITRLNQAVTQFKDGNYNVALPAVSKDEIGILTSTFDNMRETIKSSKLHLNQAYSTALENEHKFRSILEATPDPIVTINAKGAITTINIWVEREFGFDLKDIIYQPLINLLCDDTAKVLSHFLNTTANIAFPISIGDDDELFGVNKKGEKFPVEISVNTMEINRERFYILVIRNIEERKKNDKLKSDFISTISHELRTPLTAMTGSIGLLHHKVADSLDETSLNLLDIAERNTERLLLLINDILDISKLESGKMEFNFENISVMEFIDQAISVNQSYAEKYRTKFELKQSIDETITLCTDKNRLMQVISNLMSNAAKFNNEIDPVEISVERDDSKVVISIRDYGEGIPDEFKSHLFEKFTQASSGNTRGVGGTGLGLNISQAIIRELGGQIEFDSKLGEGSVFYFSLPLQIDKHQPSDTLRDTA